MKWLSKLYDVKIWVRLVIAILIAVVLSGAGLIHWSTLQQKKIAVDQAQDFANSVHQMTLAGLTGMMITGTISLRTIFLDQIKETNHIESLKVFRSQAVIDQFGAGLAGEVPSDPAELKVLQTGESHFEVITGKDGKERLKAVLPAVALENYLGKNCTFCHDVPPGTVLGTVSMEISLARANETAHQFGIQALMAGAALCVPLGLFIWYFVSSFVTRPLRQMTDGLLQIAEGDIEDAHELAQRGSDEIGQATGAFNRVMGKAHELIREQRLSRIVFDNSLEGITVTDARSKIQMVNRAFTDTTGYSAAEAIGQTPALLRSGRQDGDFYANFWKILQEKDEWRGEIWNKRKNGSIYAEWLNVSAVRDKHGDVEHYIAIFSDITERKEREDMITFKAFHDALTGLPNRQLFNDRLEQALTQAKRSKYRTPAVMFLDLDRFKQINDTLGHDAGDTLLKEVAQRLRRCARASDTVARLGGDEFTILLPEITHDSDARVVAEKILEAMKTPIVLAGKEIVITTSVGISMFPKDGRDAETLMKHADAAMYHVKASGRAGMCFFAAELLGKPSRRLELEEQLKVALERKEFVLHYQPLVDLHTGKNYANEALIRWNDPTHGLRLPEDFLALAVETGLILPLGEWIVETACLQAREWQRTAPGTMVAINLSAREFHRPDLADMMRATLKRNGLSPQLLEIEISEAVAMQDIDYSVRTLQQLVDIGLRVALDDFGTGYSSLTALRQLPLHALKIDRAFVRECTSDEGDRSIVAAIIGTASALDLKVIAEGVETEEQLELLRTLACDMAQGYLFGRPAAHSQ